MKNPHNDDKNSIFLNNYSINNNNYRINNQKTPNFMNLDNILQFFMPKTDKFFILFEQASANLVVTSQVLVEALNATNIEKRTERIKEIERLEHIGDSITHNIYKELSANFITPFDREDIHELASVVDDILDFIHGSAKRIELYKPQVITKEMQKMAELILTGNEELHKAILELRNLKNAQRIKEACIKINSIENHADDIFDIAVAKLFEHEKDAVEIIKIKEILAALETATDKCEDAANVLDSIIVKNS